MYFENNVTALDAWTIVHVVVTFGIGWMFGKLSKSVPNLRNKVMIGYWSIQAAIFIGSLLIVAWEIGEQQGAFVFMGCVNESPVNYLADTFIGFIMLLVGYFVGGGYSRFAVCGTETDSG